MHSLVIVSIVPAHFTGATNELKAATYFLEKNHQVYFPVCQQGQVDFVVDLDSNLTRAQVKTATWNRSHPKKDLFFLQCRIRQTNAHQIYKPKEMYDILCIVYKEEMWVIPALELDDTSNVSLRTAKCRPCKWDQYKVK